MLTSSLIPCQRKWKCKRLDYISSSDGFIRSILFCVTEIVCFKFMVVECLSFCMLMPTELTSFVVKLIVCVSFHKGKTWKACIWQHANHPWPLLGKKKHLTCNMVKEAYLKNTFQCILQQKPHTHKKCYEAPFQIPYLSTPCLNHELTSKVLNRCRFQWPQDNTFIKRVPWNYSPVIKHRGAKRLPLSMVPQVCLKPKWFYHWQKCLKKNK